MAELHVTTWDGHHTFHLRHNQKTHGRRGVSEVEVKGDAADNWRAAAKERDKISINAEPRQAAAYGGWRNYTGNGFRDVNDAARDPSIANDIDLKNIAAMDDFISYAGVRNANPITVHRGVDQFMRDTLLDAKPGTVFVEDGFLSTSGDPKVAEAFGSEGGLKLEIHVPKGQKAGMGSDWETELIYPRGANLKVGTYDPKTNTLQMDMLARD